MGRFRVSMFFLGVVALLAGTGLALTPDGVALLEFKRGLTQTSPTLMTWKASDASPCSWGGISCTARGQVQNITLSAQVPKLRGNISSSLGRLKSLQGLMLEHNLLSGSIPRELGNLRSLLTLSLSNNSLIGKIPPQLGQCRNLVELWLDYNELTGTIPESLGNLRNLSSVFLGVNLPLINVNRRDKTSGFNVLTGSIPPMLFKNMNLRAFDVSCNNLSGDITPVFEELSRYPGLEWISMEVNSFTGTLPSSIGDATSLWWMNLWGQGRGFGGKIPKEIGKLTNLTYLGLSDNNFDGPIPQEIGNLVSLKHEFSLDSNNIHGSIPDSIGNLVHLEILSIWNNKLSGAIPPELGNMASLKHLGLERNNLSGSIPSSLGNLTNLEALYLGDNNLNGSIPSSLGKLVKLNRLILYFNRLVGPIPDNLTFLTNLKSLGLQYNRLTGTIPTNISNMTSLVFLDLQHNNLLGPLPEDFGMFMPNLENFAINNNFISGTIPDGLCKGGKLRMLDLSDNRLEGAIPLSLARCTSLVAAGLMDNQFTSIPDYFGSNSSLERISVARNQLAGQLPKGFGSNSKLAQLDLNDNKFSGDISILGFHDLRKNLSTLNLANNYLTGEIPVSLAACRLLFRLDLSHNFLTGDIPLAFENLTNLETLQLQGNNFTKFPPTVYSSWSSTLRTLNLAENPWNTSIASEIGSLVTLQTLNLSYGGFTGPIPSELGKLIQLEVLDLSYNSLEGEVPNELGELMVSLISVNISFNRLKGSLPAKWVKFLKSHPNSFRGNPGLCLEYNTTTSQCVTKSFPRKAQNSIKITLAIATSVAFILVILIASLCWWLQPSTPSPKLVPSVNEIVVKNFTKVPLPFTFEEIMAATQNLDDAYIIGEGGHGVVYKVESTTSATPIAVKKIKSLDMASAFIHKSFWNEVETIGNAKHRNLVRMLGFIKCGTLGLLLYEYVSNGDLHSALHKEDQGCKELSWKARLHIAQGVANGLAYLHHDYESPIVHRDIKSSNVLLDHDLEAHISDFGLAKVIQASTLQPQSEQQWLSSLNISGTFGYIAPEVGYGTPITPKMDVYSFGVLLLELLTGRQPANASYDEAWHVVAWVRASIQENNDIMNESILDPSLLQSPNIAFKKEMMCVRRIALLCTNDIPSNRPTMRDVVQLLKLDFERIEVENKVEVFEVGESSIQMNGSNSL